MRKGFDALSGIVRTRMGQDALSGDIFIFFNRRRNQVKLPIICKALHKIGRKNYLFAGSHEAAQRSAMLYSLLGTCKLHGVNPFIWLRDVLAQIATCLLTEGRQMIRSLRFSLLENWPNNIHIL